MKGIPVIYPVLVGGSIAGTLDLSYAVIFAATQGFAPLSLFQFIASGLLGNAAYDGGTLTAALGLCLHFLLSYLYAYFFYLMSRRFPIITRRPVVSGALYGILVFGLMKLVILPLSAFPNPITFKPLSTITNLLSHMFFFGTPISLTTRYFRLRNHTKLSRYPQ